MASNITTTITLNRGADRTFSFSFPQVDGTLIDLTQVAAHFVVKGQPNSTLPIVPSDSDPTIGYVDFTLAWIAVLQGKPRTYAIHFTYPDGAQESTADCSLVFEGFAA